MIKENPLWGAPTLHGELIKLGIVISERTVSNMVKRYRVGNPPSQTWRTFLKNTPFERPVQFEPKNGILIPLLRVGGLHHRYIWKEAA